ncbi:MAG: hypothetical protein GXN99_01660 [Candidatus Nanohaloarchaeota archaeon]|nr:hypothetical protein [Candidatus Nanohaloarchaeota archaeon]
MVSFDIFGKSKKKKKIPLSHFAEIAKKMLKSGKTQQEVAAWLKSQGLKNEHIDAVMRHIIKEVASSSPASQPKPPVNPSMPQQAPAEVHAHQPSALNDVTHTAMSAHPHAEVGLIPSPPQQTAPPEMEDEEKEEDTSEDEFLRELEEVIDLVLQNKYGDIAKMKETLSSIESHIKKIEKTMEEKIAAINKKIAELESNFNASVSEINSKIDDIIPRLNALETAFKDNVPVMLDELRKIEEKIGYHPNVKSKQEKKESSNKVEVQTSQEQKKEELFDLKELIKGE